MKSTKHVENVLKLMARTFEKTVFERKGCKISLKQETWTNVKTPFKRCRNAAQIRPWSSTKMMLKHITPQIEKYLRNVSQIDSKKWVYFGGGASWVIFGSPNRFWASEVGPQRSKSASNDQKISQTWHQSPPIVTKPLKVKPFRSLAWRTARSAYKKNAQLQRSRRKSTVAVLRATYWDNNSYETLDGSKKGNSFF